MGPMMETRMPRLPRLHVQDRPLMELCNRVCQGFALLRPDEDFNALVIGALAKAQELFPVAVHGGQILSTHLHLLCSPADVEQQAGFMAFFTRHLSMIAAGRHDWQGSMFPQRYSALEISPEESAQVERLKYVLSNGCKEGLVASPLEWPGVGFAAALVGGGRLKGVWVNRAALYAARRRGEDVSERDFAEPVELVLSPLPCWAHLGRRRYRGAVAGLIREIEKETAGMHRAAGTLPAGAAAVQRARPLSPRPLERTPGRWVYARSLEVVSELLEGLKQKVVSYRAAADLLRSGLRQTVFPPNCFPPALPFEPSTVSSVSVPSVSVPGDSTGPSPPPPSRHGPSRS